MEILKIMKRLYFLQQGSIKTYQKVFGHYTGIREYNTFTTKYKRNFVTYYLHSSSAIRKDINNFLNLKSRKNTRKQSTLLKVA